MQFIVGSPVHEVKKLSMYELIIDTMEGDADDYHQIVLTFKKGEEDKLAEIVVLLNKIEQDGYTHGRYTKPGYRHVEGFEELLGDEWPCDHAYGIQDSFCRYTLYFYDSGGVKCTVDIKEY